MPRLHCDVQRFSLQQFWGLQSSSQSIQRYEKRSSSRKMRTFSQCKTLFGNRLAVKFQARDWETHVQRPLARFLRACMILPVFVGCFQGRAHDGRGVHNAYMIVTRLLGCVILFCFANVLSALLAKIMSTHFHKDAHFSKMNDALQKVSMRMQIY